MLPRPCPPVGRLACGAVSPPRRGPRCTRPSAASQPPSHSACAAPWAPPFAPHGFPGERRTACLCQAARRPHPGARVAHILLPWRRQVSHGPATAQGEEQGRREPKNPRRECAVATTTPPAPGRHQRTSCCALSRVAGVATGTPAAAGAARRAPRVPPRLTPGAVSASLSLPKAFANAGSWGSAMARGVDHDPHALWRGALASRACHVIFAVVSLPHAPCAASQAWRAPWPGCVPRRVLEPFIAASRPRKPLRWGADTEPALPLWRAGAPPPRPPVRPPRRPVLLGGLPGRSARLAVAGAARGAGGGCAPPQRGRQQRRHAGTHTQQGG